MKSISELAQPPHSTNTSRLVSTFDSHPAGNRSLPPASPATTNLERKAERGPIIDTLDDFNLERKSDRLFRGGLCQEVGLVQATTAHAAALQHATETVPAQHLPCCWPLLLITLCPSEPEPLWCVLESQIIGLQRSIKSPLEQGEILKSDTLSRDSSYGCHPARLPVLVAEPDVRLAHSPNHFVVPTWVSIGPQADSLEPVSPQAIGQVEVP
jgi:hypothetical protein